MSQTLTQGEPLADILDDIEAALLIHPLLLPENRIRYLDGLDRVRVQLEEATTGQKVNPSYEPLGDENWQG